MVEQHHNSCRGSSCKCGARIMLQKGWALAAAREARRPSHLVEPHTCHGRDQQEPVALCISPNLYSADGGGISHAAHSASTDI